MTGPSDKAVQAAIAGSPNRPTVAECTVHIVYPVIREDVLREVVEALREFGGSHQSWNQNAADFIEREFVDPLPRTERPA